jgi:hypothetical protein
MHGEAGKLCLEHMMRVFFSLDEKLVPNTFIDLPPLATSNKTGSVIAAGKVDRANKEPSELELILEREDIANFRRKLDKYHCELDNAVRNMEVRWKVQRRRTEY